MTTSACKICRRPDCEEVGIGEHVASRGGFQPAPPTLTPSQVLLKYRMEVEAAVYEGVRMWN